MRQLEKHFKKERSSIVRRANKLQLYREDNYDGYTVDDLILGFGLSGNDKILQWIKKGWLRGEKRIIAFNLQKWYFSDKAIQDFIRMHPDQIDPHKFDWHWVHSVCFLDVGRLDDSTYVKRTK